MLGVRVQDGTGAGSRVVKSSPPWYCGCHGPELKTIREGRIVWSMLSGWNLVEVRHLHPGHTYSCADCGARRP